MLRVGLTGGLGSGKSTAAAGFAALGAHVLSADEIARGLMEPGERVYGALVERFGAEIVLADGRLDRAALARIAFADGRVEELNAIVHPATIARQAEHAKAIGERDAGAIVIVESALIFESRYSDTGYDGDATWRKRFDKLILVTAPEELRVERFITRSIGESAPNGVVTEELRSKLEAEAHRRIARQMPDDHKAALCDYVLTNDGPLAELEWQMEQLWPLLRAAARNLIGLAAT